MDWDAASHQPPSAGTWLASKPLPAAPPRLCLPSHARRLPAPSLPPSGHGWQHEPGGGAGAAAGSHQLHSSRHSGLPQGPPRREPPDAGEQDGWWWGPAEQPAPSLPAPTPLALWRCGSRLCVQHPRPYMHAPPPPAGACREPRSSFSSCSVAVWRCTSSGGRVWVGRRGLPAGSQASGATVPALFLAGLPDAAAAAAACAC